MVEEKKLYGQIRGPYNQKTVKKRIEALFLDNLGKILTSEQIKQVAKDPYTGKQPENWHQRLSELRTDDGYTILTWRNRGDLRVEEYMMPSADKRPTAAKRLRPTAQTWKLVLERAGNRCEWEEDGQACRLGEGDTDPVSGGRVRLTPDHKAPHSVNPDTDPLDATQWRALCGRHQVMKRNYWDSTTGKLNIHAIIQSATRAEKLIAFRFLLDYFGYILHADGSITRADV
ncbi:MAG: restriction endonuclease [Anaerolineae bacterium]|nr:restriction endonuclease [Anaerolineae bacterium]